MLYTYMIYIYMKPVKTLLNLVYKTTNSYSNKNCEIINENRFIVT